MKKPTPGSQKKVTVENLVGLGAERLAEILVGVAETRVDLKRRLRMELAAEQGPAPLSAEIDKRLNALETSRGHITWRQRPAFIRDLDALRDLIVVRLSPLDPGAAVERLWRFMDAARQSRTRYRDRNGEFDRVYAQAAAGLGALLTAMPVGVAASDLVDSFAKAPAAWTAWLPHLLEQASPQLAAEALVQISDKPGGAAATLGLIRQLADAASDVDAFRATYPADAQKSPSVAALIGLRLLAAGRIDEAGEVLREAAPTPPPRKPIPLDFAWETAWIDYLGRAGRMEDAQAVRWQSFERTLSAERLRAFLGQLAEFDAVEAEQNAFDTASRWKDFGQGLSFLMDWPALAAAGRMVEARAAEAQVEPEAAELWAGKLRRRYPKAANELLRRASEAARRRRDYKTSDRLAAEADTITV